MPVSFKWFAPSQFDGSLGFGGEESAGASFVRMDGSAWTTDKDGIVAALLAGEIKAKPGRDPGQLYEQLTQEFGKLVSIRVEVPATPAQKKPCPSYHHNRSPANCWQATTSQTSSPPHLAT